MKVFFDHQIFSFQQYGGISRYFAMLARQFESNESFDCTPVYIMKSNVNDYFRDLAVEKGIKNVKPDWRKNFFVYYLENRFYTKRLLKRIECDILHPTFYDPYILKKRKRPLVLTIHDMTTERFPELFNNTLYGKLVSERWIRSKRKLAQEAELIIAISENTKKDIIEIYGIPAQKIKVVYHGYVPFSSYSERHFLEKPYFLYVGMRGGYKNFEFFIKSVADFLRRNDFFVFCSGGNSFSPSENSFLMELGIKDRVFQRNLPDAELAAAYRDAIAFVYPSLYEGFGFPILEAFSAGTPCLLAKSSCFPEIAGEAALYFDPKNSDSILESIEKISFSPDLRNSIQKKGDLLFRKFTWEECAGKTADVYRQVCSIL